MKRFTLLTTGLLVSLAGFAQAKTVPYSSSLANDADWTVVDANADDTTWAVATTSDLDGSGFSEGIKIKYHSSNAADDWYISPAVHLEAGTEYKVKFLHRTYNSTTKENYRLYFASAGSVDDLKAGEVLMDHSDYAEKAWNKDCKVITVDESGDYYFGFHGFSIKNQWYVYLTGFQVGFNTFTPAGVSDFTVTPGENRALSATLTWTLPATDDDGVKFADGVEVENVMVYRDGVLVATLPGDATEWTDDATKGLESGIHAYEVEVKANGAISAKAKVETPYIGPIAASALPWKADFRNMTQDDFAFFFTTFNTENSQTNDKVSKAYREWYISGYSAGYRYLSKYAVACKKDDWFVTPPLKVEKAGIYRINSEMKSYASTRNTNTNVYLGTGTAYENFTSENKIGTFNANSESNISYPLYFRVAEPGEYYLAFQELDQEGTVYNGVYIYNLAVEEWHEAPNAVENLATEVDGENVKLSWTNPVKSNIGMDIAALSKIEVYRNGAEEPTYVITDAEKLVGGAEVELVDEAPGNGIFNYTVVPYMGEYAVESAPEVVYTKWVGEDLQTLPYTTDFKDGVLNNLWTVKDLDGDENTWKVVANGYSSGASLYVYQSEDDLAKMKDALVSASFELTPGYYKLTSGVKGGQRNLTVKAGLVAADDENLTMKYSSDIKTEGLSYSKSYDALFKVTEAGKYRLVYLYNDFGTSSTSSTDKTITLTEVKFAYQPVLPKVATELTVTPHPERGMGATLTWKNPSETNVEGVGAEITKAVIHRLYLTESSEYEEIATVTEDLVPGEYTTYVDDNVIRAGEYRYRVDIHGPEGKHEDTGISLKTSWIGGGMDTPFESSDFSKWTVHNVDNDYFTEDGDKYAKTWEVSSSKASITYTSKEGNDWLVSLPINIDAEGVYDIEISKYGNYGSGASEAAPQTFDLYAGTSTDYNDMSVKIGTVAVTSTLQANATVSTFRVQGVNAAEPAMLADEDDTEAYVKIPAGVSHFGFHANSKGDFSVNRFAVKAIVTGVEDVVVSDDVIVDGVAIPADVVNITVYDVAGKCVVRAANVAELSIKALNAGVYVVTGESNGSAFSVKLLRK